MLIQRICMLVTKRSHVLECSMLCVFTSKLISGLTTPVCWNPCCCRLATAVFTPLRYFTSILFSSFQCVRWPYSQSRYLCKDTVLSRVIIFIFQYLYCRARPFFGARCCVCITAIYGLSTGCVFVHRFVPLCDCDINIFLLSLMPVY